MNEYDGGRNQAKSTFRHYMTILWKRTTNVHTGKKMLVDSDNKSEWDDIIDCIMDGVKAEIKAEDKYDTEKAEEVVNETIETIKVLQRDNQRMREELQTYIKWWDDNPNGFTLLSVMRHTKELLGEIYGE